MCPAAGIPDDVGQELCPDGATSFSLTRAFFDRLVPIALSASRGLYRRNREAARTGGVRSDSVRDVPDAIQYEDIDRPLWFLTDSKDLKEKGQPSGINLGIQRLYIVGHIICLSLNFPCDRPIMTS